MLSAQVYLNVLACIARADGKLDPAEAALLDRAVAASGLSDRATEGMRKILDMQHQPQVDSILSEAVNHLSPALLVDLLRDGYVMASADGQIAAAEVNVLDRLIEKAGIPENRRATLHQWAQRAARHQMDGLHIAADSLPHQ